MQFRETPVIEQTNKTYSKIYINALSKQKSQY